MGVEYCYGSEEDISGRTCGEPWNTAFWSLREEGSYEEEPVYVGVAYYDQSDTFINALIDCLKEESREYEDKGCEVAMQFRGAGGSQRTQNDQVKELIDAGCNVLCVNLVDRADPSEIIDLARENDVPVIFFNREPVAEDMMQWDRLYYVGALFTSPVRCRESLQWS